MPFPYIDPRDFLGRWKRFIQGGRVTENIIQRQARGLSLERKQESKSEEYVLHDGYLGCFTTDNSWTTVVIDNLNLISQPSLKAVEGVLSIRVR